MTIPSRVPRAPEARNEELPEPRSSPLSRFQELLSSGSVLPDEHQLEAVRALDSLWHRLQGDVSPTLWQRISRKQPEFVKGLYLWGGVGRGKTWLMGLFFDCLTGNSKRRIHFHRFMQSVHLGLKQRDGEQNPLAAIAEEWANECRVLCLDEFFVTDIGDAMLLAVLLENLFARGVTLVTTSNIEPDKLYQDGLQRAKFLPAIVLLKRNTQVLELKGSQDYRLRMLEQSPVYHWPLSEEAESSMERSFERFAAGCELEPCLMINERPFQAIRRSDGIIWFSFAELCEKPNGSRDFIEIAQAFKTVLVSGVPQLTEEDTNAARRFILMVDEFYDRSIKLLISAQTPPELIYTGKRLKFEFERTVSRLTEMQTRDYLAKPHPALGQD